MPLVMSEAKSTFSFHVKAMSLLASSSSRQPPFTYCEQRQKAGGCAARHRLPWSFPGAEPSLANPGAPPLGWRLGMPPHAGGPVCGTVQIPLLAQQVTANLWALPHCRDGCITQPWSSLTGTELEAKSLAAAQSTPSATDSVGTR